MLKTPRDVCLSNGKLQWPPVPCADGYNIHYGDRYVATASNKRFRNVSGSREWPPTGVVDDWIPEGAPLDEKWTISAYSYVEGMPDNSEHHTSRSLPANDKPIVGSDLGNLIFFDDFTHHRTETWATDHIWTPTVINNELQTYGSNLYPVLQFGEDGLTINAIKDAQGVWHSGLLQSWGNLEVRDNVYVEGRMKLPAGAGLWPAFWLMNAKYDGLTQNEIDILEMLGNDPLKVYHTFHHLLPNGSYNYNAAQFITNIDATDWHTYGLERRNGQLRWFVDGFPVGTFRDDFISDEPLYLILNLAVGGNWPGDPDPALERAEMKVEFVRVVAI